MKLVDFSDPPVVETVLSVGFSPVEGLNGAQVGQFWTQVQDAFPRVSEQLPYDMPHERLSDNEGLSLELSVGRSAPKSRFWLTSNDDRQLLQIQRDWFAYNWRFRPGGTYADARYAVRRDTFAREFEAFRTFVGDQKLGSVEPRQCEVTYINHVEATGSAADDLSEILQFVSRPSLSRLTSRIETWDTTLTILLKDESQGVFGRLHVRAQPGRDGDRRVWQINLTARGRSVGSGLEGVLKFMDLGHEAIVVNFKEMTTDHMHQQWGLQ